MNTSEFFVIYEEKIASVTNWVASIIAPMRKQGSSSLIDRIIQVFIQKSIKYYADEALIASIDNKKVFDDCKILQCEKFFVINSNNQIYLPLRFAVFYVTDFVKYWLFYLFAICFPSFKKYNLRFSSLIYGVPTDSIFCDNSDEAFVDYCNNGPIDYLKTQHFKIIQTSHHASTSECPNIIYTKNPLSTLLRLARLGPILRTKLVIKHFKVFFQFFYNICIFKPILIISKDFSCEHLAIELDEMEFIKMVILTISNYSDQPLWMRALIKGKVCMIWYSQNTLLYTDKKIGSIADPPFLKRISADFHLVWTDSFKKYMQNLIPTAAFQAIGPIVWQCPKITDRSDDKIIITVFDVSPYAEGLSTDDGDISPYVCRKNLIKFIDDIIIARDNSASILGKNILIRLKTKRGYKFGYDKYYFEYIESLNARGVISIVDYGINIYKLISSSELIISYPFTSVNYIADNMAKPAIYYDPTDSIMYNNMSDVKFNTKFIQKFEILNNEVFEIVKKFDMISRKV